MFSLLAARCSLLVLSGSVVRDPGSEDSRIQGFAIHD